MENDPPVKNSYIFLGNPSSTGCSCHDYWEGKGHLIWTEIKCPDSKGNIMSYHVCPKPSTNQVPIGRHKQLLRRINRSNICKMLKDHQRNHDCHSHKHFISHWEFMDPVGWPWLKSKFLHGNLYFQTTLLLNSQQTTFQCRWIWRIHLWNLQASCCWCEPRKHPALRSTESYLFDRAPNIMLYDNPHITG